ncbi:MAG: polysaccharide deacetylase family protein [Kyrpidia tusciae]|nr:polysaccharide deacetylase family protein [Kyrpidia tusciae]MBE3551427.1 polysaccharide deacetylase family protein [Kyrpidia tusciae]
MLFRKTSRHPLGSLYLTAVAFIAVVPTFPGHHSLAPTGDPKDHQSWNISASGSIPGQNAPIRTVQHSGQCIALTFDDGPHPIYTPQLLYILRKHRVRATFFLTGVQCEKHPSIVKRIAAEGHELGNHGYLHARLDKMSPESVAADIRRADQVIVRITGIWPHYFRPAGGVLTPTVLQAATQTGHPIAMWSVDPRDWVVGRDATAITAVVKDTVGPGRIVLFHDGGGNQPRMLEALDSLLDFLKKQGYQFVTLSEE